MLSQCANHLAGAAIAMGMFCLGALTLQTAAFGYAGVFLYAAGEVAVVAVLMQDIAAVVAVGMDCLVAGGLTDFCVGVDVGTDTIHSRAFCCTDVGTGVAAIRVTVYFC